MPKYGTNELFQLIKSLSKSEKGYFKKFALLNSATIKANYERLFDAIDKQQTYDEVKLKQKVKTNLTPPLRSNAIPLLPSRRSLTSKPSSVFVVSCRIQARTLS